MFSLVFRYSGVYNYHTPKFDIILKLFYIFIMAGEKSQNDLSSSARGRGLKQDNYAIFPVKEAPYPIFFVIRNSPAWRFFVQNSERIRWGAVLPVTVKQLRSLQKDTFVLRAYDSDREHREGSKI